MKNNCEKNMHTNTKGEAMAKNNGKNFLFLIACVLIVTLTLVAFGCNRSLSAKSTISHNILSGDLQRVSQNDAILSNNTTDKLQSTVQENVICASNPADDNIELLCLMYHNVVGDNQKQGDYEMRVSTMEKDFAELKNSGYKCVLQRQLVDIVDNHRYGKYAMITFDDGFFGVYKYIPNLLEKYDMNCVVAVTGEFIDIADKQNYKTRCSYMNTEEVKSLSKNPRVEIAHHSYNYHHIKDGRKGVGIKNGESGDAYIEKFSADTKKLENKLSGLGVKMKTYCYPYGVYCKESEKVLKELGYQMTMTCNEKVNYLHSRDSLFLLSRINRSARYQNIDNLLQCACKK